MLTIHWQQ